MTSWDDVSVAIAIVATAGTVVLLVVLFLWPGRWGPIEFVMEETAEVPIRIRFTGEPAWYIESVVERRTVIVDTFTFRCCDGAQPGPWRHELMDRAIRLLPGQTARIASSIDGEHWDAAAGWTLFDEDLQQRGSRYVHLVRAPD
ncbi:MAG: hypothetical protein ABIP17_11690 [Ilumatobacteraceae bacterium]